MNDFIVKKAGVADLQYVDDIVKALKTASENKGTGIAVRSSEYITGKILEDKAVVAISEAGRWAGFCYIESWGHNKFVANSGLVVSENFRGFGLAKSIKKMAMHLSQKMFPGARLFGLTTSLAVMKINSDLGYRPVTFSELTDDLEFWKGCESCPYYDILVRTRRTQCLCTGMLMHMDKEKQNESELKTKIVSIPLED